jgi:dephospho-CoA kinase
MLPDPSCLRAGITGGIGSGKTTVCQIFETLGVPVYYADHWAKWLVVHDAALRAAIEGEFGRKAYTAAGEYDRAYIAGVVFADATRLQALNALVHPAVERHAAAWHGEQAALGHAYTLKEAALLIESGSYRHLDRLIVVTAPEDERIRRVMQRDGLDEAAVRARLRSQLPETEKVALADLVIVNDGRQALIPQVLAVHRALELAAKKTM